MTADVPHQTRLLLELPCPICTSHSWPPILGLVPDLTRWKVRDPTIHPEYERLIDDRALEIELDALAM